MNQDQANQFAEEVELPAPQVVGTFGYTSTQIREIIATALVQFRQGQTTLKADEWEHAKFVQRVLEAGPMATEKDRADAYWIVRQFRQQAWNNGKETSQQEERKPLTEEECLVALEHTACNDERFPIKARVRVVRAVEEFIAYKAAHGIKGETS